MAGPAGHILCAALLVKSGMVDSEHKKEVFLGASFPDIRYIVDIRRSKTHRIDGEGLSHVLEAKTPFELGRRFHVFIDIERETYMREHDAYRFVKNGPLKAQLLKIIEDEIVFDMINDFNAKEIFSTIVDEEREYAISENDLRTWHNLLATYLDQSHWFNVLRYYRSLVLFQKAYGAPSNFFGDFWQSIKTLGFFIYAYVQVEYLSRNQELKKIILDFYEKKIEQIIELEHRKVKDQTVKWGPMDVKESRHRLCLIRVTMPRSSSRCCSVKPSFL